jgi:hypothetical protein
VARFRVEIQLCKLKRSDSKINGKKLSSIQEHLDESYQESLCERIYILEAYQEFRSWEVWLRTLGRRFT